MTVTGKAAPATPSRSFERLGYVLTRFAFAVVIFIFIAAPILAVSWRSQPFPGFLVEQTLVVNDSKGENWSGLQAGIKPGEHVIRIAGLAVTTPADYQNAISLLAPGEKSVVFTILQDGSGRLYPEVVMGRMPARDFIRLFWLPYFVGLFYLGIGAWIYGARGSTHSGLALTIFCLLTAVVSGLVFDLSTSHFGTISWTLAITMTVAALISLAMCFPQEWPILRHRLWVLALPYALVLPLVVWNLAVIYDTNHPWAYYSSWGATYRFIALGILFFIGVMIYHARRSAQPVVRRQARIVLLGSMLAFTPILLWFLWPLLNRPLEFNSSIFLPPLVLFPLSIGIAILRYRLWEIDTIINRTVVYGLLTAILAGIFTAMIAFSQRLFIAMTGEKSDAAIVLTTLIVGSAIAPVRTRLQVFVDRQFKETPDQTKTLQAFGNQVQSYLEMNNSHQLTRRLLHESAEALKAESGAVVLPGEDHSPPRILHTYRNWKGQVLFSMPVEYGGVNYGLLQLGPRVDGKPYTQQEYKILKKVSDQVAAAIQISDQQ